MSNVRVSVICLAYNHGRFIKDALEGFVKQKTNFDFEVLVHDDASTDQTADVIREYAAKYPNIIKPVLQKENQYSKNVSIIHTFLLPMVKGDYLAICEGDDYWIDENKLQKQVDCLDQHPECSFCSCAALEVDINGKKTRELRPYPQTGVYSIKDFPDIATNIPTASMMYRTSLCKYGKMTFQKLSAKAHNSIRARQLYLLSKGENYYDSSIMAAYRIGNSQSWMGRLKTSGEKARIQVNEANIEMLTIFDKETNYEFSDTVQLLIQEQEFAIACARRDYSVIKNKKYDRLYARLSKKEKAVLFLQCKMPALYACILSLKRRILK